MSNYGSSFTTPPQKVGKAIAALAEKILLMAPAPVVPAEGDKGGGESQNFPATTEDTFLLRKSTLKEKEHDEGPNPAVVDPQGKIPKTPASPKPSMTNAFINTDPVLREVIDDVRFAATDISRRRADRFSMHLVAQLFCTVVDFTRGNRYVHPDFRDALISLTCDVISSGLYKTYHEPEAVDIERFYQRNENARPLYDAIGEMFSASYMDVPTERRSRYIPGGALAMCLADVLRQGVYDAGKIGGTLDPAIEGMLLDYARGFRGTEYHYAAPQLLGVKAMIEQAGLLETKAATTERKRER